MAVKQSVWSQIGAGVSGLAGGFSMRMGDLRAKVGHMEFVRRVTYWFLLPTAFYTTWHGLNDIVTYSNPRAGLITISITLLVAGMLFLLMNYTVTVWRSFEGTGARIAALVLYILTATISVAFAFSFWWTTFYARERTAAETQRSADVIAKVANDANANLSSLQRSLMALAELSRARSQTEATAGGTCGDASGPNRGPRARLRERDAETFDGASKYIGALAIGVASDLSTLETSIKAVSTEAFREAETAGRSATIASINQAITSVGNKLNQARMDQRFLDYQGEFERRLAISRDGFQEAGRTYSCPDSDLETTLLSAITSIRQVGASPDFSQARIPLIEEGRATMYAFQLFLNTGQAMIFGMPQDEVSTETARQDVADTPADASSVVRQLETIGQTAPGVITGTQWFAFFLALFIDVGIAVVGLGKRRDHNAQGRQTVLEAQDPANAALLDVLEKLRDPSNGLEGQMGPYHVVVFGEDYLVAPNQPEAEPEYSSAQASAFAVGNLAALLTAARLAREVTPANPFVRKILERLRHNQRGAGAVLAMPGPPSPLPEDMDEDQKSAAPDWLLKTGRWVRSVGAAVFADPYAAQARLHYRFFKVSAGVFNSLQFQSVARGS